MEIEEEEEGGDVVAVESETLPRSDSTGKRLIWFGFNFSFE